MRFAIIAAGIFLAGCVTEDPQPPLPALSDYSITALSTLAECAARGEAFTLTAVLANHEARTGVARVDVMAQQFGKIVNEDVKLAPRETRSFDFATSIDIDGVWSVYAVAAHTTAGAVSVHVPC